MEDPISESDMAFLCEAAGESNQDPGLIIKVLARMLKSNSPAVREGAVNGLTSIAYRCRHTDKEVLSGVSEILFRHIREESLHGIEELAKDSIVVIRLYQATQTI